MNVLIIGDECTAAKKLQNLLYNIDKDLAVVNVPDHLDSHDSVEQLIALTPAKTQRRRFLTRLGTRLTSVPVENIAYFYTLNKLQYIKTKSNEDLLIDKNLEDIETEVDPHQFFRVNRQFIVQFDSIERVNAWFSGKLKLQVKPSPYEDIVISRLKANEFKRWLGE